MSSGFSPIDPETPKDVLLKTSRRDGEQWQLVFSDEFNTEGRSFYPGDDPYWEAVDLNYWVRLCCHRSINRLLIGSQPSRLLATWNGTIPLRLPPLVVPWPSHSSARKPMTYTSRVVRSFVSLALATC